MKNLSLLLLLLSARVSFAVPVPYINCGKAGDTVSVQLLDADRWPPGISGPSVPIYAEAEMDPDTGFLREMKFALVPLNWVFVLRGSFNAYDNHGFVALPEGWLTTGSPDLKFTTHDFYGLPNLNWQSSLPILAGPIISTDVIPPFDPNGTPLTATIHASVGSSIPSLIANVWVSYNGISGFPIVPKTGPKIGKYSAQLHSTTSTGDEALCMETQEVDSPVVTVTPIPFGDFDFFHSKDHLDLSFSYGYSPIPSQGMDPSVWFRSCAALPSANIKAEGKGIQYNVGTRKWNFYWDTSDLNQGCYLMSVESGLTGQVDGPFKVEI